MFLRRTTDESFDTIALHSQELHDALMKQWDDSISQKNIKLTGEQAFLSQAMGVPVPFLPFANMEEKRQFGLCQVNSSFPQDDERAAIKWCDYVDGKSIMPKLPVHFRNHRQKYERNERVRQAVENAEPGNARLAQLNAALESSANTAQIHHPAPIPQPEPQAMREEPYIAVARMSIVALQSDQEKD